MATQRITAKFNSKCAACKKPTLKDSDIEYDYEKKIAYHPQCRPGVGSPREESFLDGDCTDGTADGLAAKLGFVDHKEGMASSGAMFLLPRSHRGHATGR